ncbi:unnamed protein product [Durusdinium trenchii]|uniref:Calmodulin n=1 Tax=Durusdinium trenchii TaxID=1381693 RepID=A0ABP0MPC8_9DINO
MSVQPTPRSLAGSGSLDATNVAELTSQVFEILANGQETIGLQEFRRTAKHLAQLSEDYTADPDDAFNRIDLNSNQQIDRAEFEQEINEIRGLLGTRKLAAALAQVQQECQIRQSFGDAEPEATSQDDLGMRTHVLEQMVGYFSTLRDDYNSRLEELKHKQAELQSRETRAPAPPRARIFAGRRANQKKPEKPEATQTDPMSLELTATLTRVASELEGTLTRKVSTGEVEPPPTEEADLDENENSGDEDVEEEADDVSQEEQEEDEAEDDEDEDEDEEDEADEDEEADDVESDVDKVGKASGRAPAVSASSAAPAAPMASAEKEERADPSADAPADASVDASALEGTLRLEPSEDAAEPESRPDKTDQEAAVTTAPADAVTEVPEPEPTKSKKGKKGKKKDKEKTEKRPKAKPKKEVPLQPKPVVRPGSSPPAVSSQPKEQTARPAPKAKARVEEEGMSCVQTLEMGLAVRNAICIGMEVWTVDWAGNVTVRERDDATKVRCEIPTNRFVWSMLHMEPHLMWMEQEAMGISLFDTKRKEFKGSLIGGHTGGVTCLASGDALDGAEVEKGAIPRRRAWSGSNDFTIRQWTIETWRSKEAKPEHLKDLKDAFIVDIGKFKVAISKGLQMYGHKNGVRCLIRIGPTLWSGSDDGSIRLWCTATGNCNETVDKAHGGSVLKLAVVRSFIWSSGSDGYIREWTIGGPVRECVRQIAPEGFDKGAYAIVPLGYDVWTCGHHPNIQVFSQADFFKTAEHPAHEPYVSNLLTVDRVETKIVWSTSIGDKKLKVWRHTIRGEVPNFDELKAANRLFEEEEEVRAKRLDEFVKRQSVLEDELAVSAQEYKNQLEALANDLAKSRANAEELDAKCKALEEELAGIRQLFEEMGLGKLMEDPEALADFLRRGQALEKIFKDLGLENFLENPEELRKVLEAFADLGLDDLLKNPEELKRFLSSAKELKEMLEAAGFGDVFNDPSKLEELRKQLDLLKQVREIFEKNGLGDAFKDPSLLAEVLSRYEGLRKAFEEFGFSELFEDPYNLKGFLRNYAKLRDAFRELGLEYLLDSAAAMKDFLAGHTSGEKELLDLRAKASRLDEVEDRLKRREDELARAKEEAKQLRERLAAFEAVGDLDSIKRWKSALPAPFSHHLVTTNKTKRQEASQLLALMRAKGNADGELAELRRQLEEKERERQEVVWCGLYTYNWGAEAPRQVLARVVIERLVSDNKNLTST